jgi:hypothetical protein
MKRFTDSLKGIYMKNETLYIHFFTFLRPHQVVTIICYPKAHAVIQILANAFFVTVHWTWKYYVSSVLQALKSHMLYGNWQNRGTAYMRFVAIQCQNYNAVWDTLTSFHGGTDSTYSWWYSASVQTVLISNLRQTEYSPLQVQVAYNIW